MQKFLNFLINKPYLGCISLSIILTFFTELLYRRSFSSLFSFISENPLGFIFNVLLVLLPLSVGLLFKKRLFFYSITATIWIVLGITSFILKFYRVTPFNASDFRVISSTSKIINHYLNTFQLLLVIVILIAILALNIYLFKKTPKCYSYLSRSAVFFVATTLTLTILTPKTLAKFDDFGNLSDAYDRYGFAYCFSLSALDSGISKPSDYSVENVKNVVESIGNYPASYIKDETQQKPNIIFVQLESFFNVNKLNNISYSENPIPIFTELQETCSSGHITVPSIGAGTANTEFEIITGMNLDYFGPGEYPYSTILQTNSCESINFDLKNLGYSTHAIHNHIATFYDRNVVFSNLGFDTFTSLEYMQNTKFNPLGWCLDSVLTSQITDALNSTENQDFIYTIAVQTHGKYPDEVIDPTQHIKVSGDISETSLIPFEYYINQMQQTDNFLGSLITTLSSYDEPTVVVAYGDHLPGFNYDSADIKGDSVYKTPYIIWSNFGLSKTDKDLYAYQLTSEIQSRLGFSEGLLTNIHQEKSENSEYQKDLKMLQYDMLYGDNIAFGKSEPFKPTDLQMGVNTITLYSLKPFACSLYVNGSHFTDSSRVIINEKLCKTTFINSETLLVTDTTLNTGDVISVAQVDRSNNILSQTHCMIY